MLEEVQIDITIIKILREYHEETQFAVTVDGNMTKWFAVQFRMVQRCSIYSHVIRHDEVEESE